MICAPVCVRSSGDNAFTVACVPTGIKIGVWTTPCGVVKEPERALPLVAVRVKEKDVFFISLLLIVVLYFVGNRSPRNNQKLVKTKIYNHQFEFGDFHLRVLGVHV